ncbi:MAG: CotH kinase family protein [Acidobacteriota bacterium]
MKRIILALAALLAMLIVASAFARQTEQQGEKQAKKKKAKSEDEPSQEKNHEADKLFGLDKVWTVHLKVSPEAYKALDPPNAQRGFGPGGPGGPPGFVRGDVPNNPPPDRPQQDRPWPGGPGGGFGGPGGPGPMGGIEFPEVKASVEFDGQTLDEVGLRYKGNSTFMASRNSPKKSFKLDFNQFVKKQKLFGLTKLNLNNNALDGSQIREAVSYEIFRQAGVPAPRTAFARVYLTVQGQHDKKYLGMYTIVEQVDEHFLQNHFASKEGLLLKPERIGAMPYYGEDWSKYAKPYDAKNDGTPAETKRFIALAKLVNKGRDDEFREQIRSFINVNAFLRFIALNGLMANMDSILAMGQNYYIYHDAAEDQFHWIPWDLNMSFGGFPSGSPEQMMALSIAHPHAGKHVLIDRLLAIPEIKKAYMEQVKELTAQVFTTSNINAIIEKVKATARPAIADESTQALLLFDNAMKETLPESTGNQGNDPGFGGRMGGGPMGPGRGSPLKPFIARRVESVRDQLAGKSEGYTPTNFGPMGGGRPGGPGGGFGPGGPDQMMRIGPGAFIAPQLLKAADKNQDNKLTQAEFIEAAGHWFTEWDTAKKRSLDMESLAHGLNQIIGPPPGFGPDGSPTDMPGPPDAVFVMRTGGPGTLLATAILKAADASHDHKLTQIEFKNAVAKWFKQWDEDKNQTLDEAEMRNGLSWMLPPPSFAPMDGSPAGQPAAQSKKPVAPAKGKGRKSR